MELHHKLRRDPNWHPSACNICGGMGHQAANCKTGTIPWRKIFGDEAFIVRKPVFWTDILAKRKEREVDLKKVEADAIAYAKGRVASLGMRYEDIEKTAKASQSVDTDTVLKERLQVAEELARKAKRAADPTADLPEGWAVAFDAKQGGKPYFWHTKTQKVQWDKPNAETPTS